MVFISAPEVSSGLRETSGNYWYIVNMKSNCDRAAILNYGGFLCVKNFVIKQPVKIL